MADSSMTELAGGDLLVPYAPVSTTRSSVDNTLGYYICASFVSLY